MIGVVLAAFILALTCWTWAIHHDAERSIRHLLEENEWLEREVSWLEEELAAAQAPRPYGE
jgi:hypothetical protein